MSAKGAFRFFHTIIRVVYLHHTPMFCPCVSNIFFFYELSLIFFLFQFELNSILIFKLQLPKGLCIHKRLLDLSYKVCGSTLTANK